MRTLLVVEGQGEVSALPVLLRRIAAERSLSLELVGRPFREPRNRLLQREPLRRILEFARGRAAATLIVFDADDDCAVALAASVRALAGELMPGFSVLVVVAVREFEAWFLSAAESLRGKRGLPSDLDRPASPEMVGDAKGWLSERMPNRYSPTIDQPAFASLFDLREAAEHSRSFRKLMKDLEIVGSA